MHCIESKNQISDHLSAARSDSNALKYGVTAIVVIDLPYISPQQYRSRREKLVSKRQRLHKIWHHCVRVEKCIEKWREFWNDLYRFVGSLRVTNSYVLPVVLVIAFRTKRSEKSPKFQRKNNKERSNEACSICLCARAHLMCIFLWYEILLENVYKINLMRTNCQQLNEEVCVRAESVS